MSNFYWAHFNYREWSDQSVLFGAITPFYDVVFGTCPYDIKYSVPVPFIDFVFTPIEVFQVPTDPTLIRWTTSQLIWHMGWLIGIGLTMFLLLYLQCLGYFLILENDTLTHATDSTI